MSEKTVDEDLFNDDATFGEIFDRDSKDYLIVHLDVLGYKDFVEINGEKELFASIRKGWMFAKALFDPELTMADGSTVSYEVKLRMFTDNIFISVELEGDGRDEMRVTLTINILAHLQNSIMDHSNLLLRGAITYGKCYIDDFILGKPFIEAFELESKKAIWSRIIISEKVLTHIPQKFVNTLVKKDEKGLFQLDYLRIVIEFTHSMSGITSSETLLKHKGSVLKITRNTLNDDRFLSIETIGDAIKILKITKKYHLLTKYHNDLCEEYGCEDAKMEDVEWSDTLLEQYESLTNHITEARSPKEIDEISKILLQIKNSYGKIIEPIIAHNAKYGSGKSK
ncbi:MAG: hypothetical protein FWG96_06700 [Methanomassiliicoccaceae archaeon]|nr:hypothetical protein [Methanomassiliicoccaceae archaeon]